MPDDGGWTGYVDTPEPAQSSGDGWAGYVDTPETPEPQATPGGPLLGIARQAGSLAGQALSYTGPPAWTPPPGQAVPPSPELAQRLASASAIAGRPVHAWEIGENEPGETPGELLPMSQDTAGGFHWAVPGFARGLASIGSRAAGLEPWRNGDETLTQRELKGLALFADAAPGAIPASEGWHEGFGFSGLDPAPPPPEPLRLAGPPAAARGAPPPPAGPQPMPPPSGGAPPTAPSPAPAGPAGGTLGLEPWRVLLGHPATYDEALNNAVDALTRARAQNQPLQVLTAISDALKQAKVAFGHAGYTQPAAAPPSAGAPGAQPQPSGSPTATMAPPAPPAAPASPPGATAPPPPAAPPQGGAAAPGTQAAAGAAGAIGGAPPLIPFVPIMASQVQLRDGVGFSEAANRADAENAANAAQHAASIAAATGAPPPPPVPRQIPVIQKQDSLSAHAATQARAAEADAWNQWHARYAPGLPAWLPPAGFPTPDKQMQAAQQAAVLDAPATADEILQGANYPQDKALVDEASEYLPEGFAIRHEPDLGWGLYENGVVVPGSRQIAPTLPHLQDLVAYAINSFHGVPQLPLGGPAPPPAPQGDGTRTNPVVVQNPTDVPAAAVQAQEPTPAQAAAGNARKGHVVIDGLPVTIENAAGSMRHDKAHTPPRWSVQMPAHYGYVKGTRGADGEQVDVYLGPNAHNAHNLSVYVIDQRDATTGLFDEHKVMLGFPSLAAARHVYYHAFNDGLGPARLGAISTLTWAQFRQKLDAGQFKKAHAYRTPEQHVRAAMADMGVTPSPPLVAMAVGALSFQGPHDAVFTAVKLEARAMDVRLRTEFDALLAKMRANAAAIEAELAAKGKPGTTWAVNQGAPEHERQPTEPGPATGEQPPGPGEQPAGPQPAAANAGAAGGAEPASGGHVPAPHAKQPVRPGAGAGGQHSGGQPAAGAEPGGGNQPGAAGGATETERPPLGDAGAGAEGSAGGRTGAEADLGPRSETVPDWARKRADAVRGSVVWWSNRLALIRGFSILSGQPVYAGVVWDGNVSRGSTRSIFDPAQRTLFGDDDYRQLEREAKRVVAEEDARHDARPKGPFADGRIAASKSVDVRFIHYARQLSQMVGLGGVRIFLADPRDMADEAAVETYGLYGPYAGALSAVHQDEGGSMRRMPNGAYYIAVSPNVRKSTEIETVAHEIGHILQRETFEKAERGEKDAINGAFARWLKANKDKNAEEYIKALRAHSTGKTLGAPGDTRSATHLDNYWRKFSEWFADQVARWATTDEKPLSLLDKLFDGIARGYRKLAAAAAGERYKPDALMAAWLSKQDGGMAADGAPEAPPPSTGPPEPEARPGSEAPPAPPAAPEPPAERDILVRNRRILAELDARGAPDDDYRHAFATGQKNPLKRGETWRGRLVHWIKQLELPEARPGSEPATVQAAHDPYKVIADTVADALENIQKKAALTARNLQLTADGAFGGSLASGAYSRDQLYDAIELGVNLYIQRRSRDLEGGLIGRDESARVAENVAGQLAALKDRLPTQTVRAGEKDAFQQFSTPPDYAFAAAWVAGLKPDDRVLEPSAGVGGIAVFAQAAVEKVWTNELSEKRRAMLRILGFEPTAENAEQIDNVLPESVAPTVVLMNPPFSVAATRMGNKMVLGAGARHVEQALGRLVPGGRLVAIVGRGMSPDAPAWSDWWKKIGAEYDVRANVAVGGRIYRKYGTEFETRLIVIDKVAPSGRGTVRDGEVQTAAELIALLKDVRNDRPAAEPRVRGAGQQPAGEPAGAPVAPGGKGAAEPGGGVSAPTGTVGAGAGGGTSTAAGAKPPKPGAGGAPAVAAGGTRPGSGAAGDAVVPGEPKPDAGGTAGSAAGTAVAGGKPKGGGKGAPGDSPKPDGSGELTQPGAEQTAVAATLEEAVTEPDSNAVTESVYEPYKPQRVVVKGARSHPGALVQSAAMATVLPPETSYRPTLPAGLVESGGLSDAQLEAVVYAGHAHAQMLPAVGLTDPERRRGWFCGDSTGVGKGRIVAGIILDNWLQGRQKAVWISEKKTLMEDAKRDWKGLGQKPDVLLKHASWSAGDKIDAPKGILFTTYDTLKSGESKRSIAPGPGAGVIQPEKESKSRLQQIVDWLGPDFDGVIAFDEAHNLANSVPTRGKRGPTTPAAKALAGIDLQQALPNARVVYVSATGATEVSNLAYADRLGLWGKGTAFADRTAFIAEVGSGGIAAMELVSRDMKALGYYTARSLSYDGVEYDRVEHPLTANQRDIYDKLAEGWQVVLRDISAALEQTGADRDSRAKAAAMAQFWGAHQRFFNQIITSMQMPTVIDRIEGDLKAGRQAVVQLVNTMEAAQERAVEKARANEEDLEDLDMTPRDQLMNMIEKSFPVVQYEEYVDDQGVVRSRPVRDAHGNLVLNKAAVAMRTKLLDEVGSLRVPDGPLEMLLNHFGIDKVAEVTGRKQRVVRAPNERGEMRTIVQKRPGDSNLSEANAFQAGRKPVLIFSDAGGTGRSYHAENGSGSADKRRSHYLAQPGWRADKAVQGLGRTHRTNQASAPIFHLVTTDLQGQKRFISSIARRLAQLGALTKGERRTGDQGMFGARDNLESTEARSALRQFVRDLIGGAIPGLDSADVQRQTGLRLQNDNGSPEVPEMSQFLNRLLSLKVDTQNQVFEAFSDRLDDAVERAAAAGTLDTGTETFNADRIDKVSSQVVYTDAASGAQTHLVHLAVKRRNHPVDFATVEEGGRSPLAYVVSNRSGKIFALANAHSVTDKKGNIVPQYRLRGPLDYQFIEQAKLAGNEVRSNWRRIDDKAEAAKLWAAQVAATPEFRSSDLHVITGAVLPIWDRLGGNPKIFRLQVTGGERMLARVIAPDRLPGVLTRLGVGGEQISQSPAELMGRLMDGGRVTLANGWRLKRSRVANEWRVELVGPDFSFDQQLRDDGVYSERISYSTRYFVPTGGRGQDTLKAIIARRPVVSLTSGEDDETQQLRSGRGEADSGEEPSAPFQPESFDDIEADNPDAPWFHQMKRPPQPPWNPDRPISRRLEDHLAQLPVAGNALATVAGQVFDVTDWLQMELAPMASVTATDTSRAMAKDFANRRRFIRWVAAQAVDGLTREFKPDRLKAMYEAAENESQAEQAVRITKAMRPAVPVAGGFASLSARELEVTRLSMDASREAFARAVKAGLLDPEDEIPFYMPHIVIQIGTPDARVVEDIRALVLATMQLDEAVVGKLLINRIEAVGRRTGMATVHHGGTPGTPNVDPWLGVTKTTPRTMKRKIQTVPELNVVAKTLIGDDGTRWFTLEQSPAFKHWVVSGKKEDGSPNWVKQPIYLRGDFEGPLKAVMRRPTDKLTRAYMSLKGRMMTSIMYGLSHLFVIAGRALPVTGRPIPIKFMREGGVAMHDPVIMRRAIEQGGMDPIGKRWAFRGEMGANGDLFDLRPGRSWTAQILGLLARPLGAGASEATKRGVDIAGDWAHNRMLWERVGALQAGIYLHFEREGLAAGDSASDAAVFAGHMANRWAGALPAESMSKLATDLANWFLFSRTYRLGNIGVVKDAILGPPKGTVAMIGAGRRAQFTRNLRRTMARAIAIDLLLYHGAADLVQSGFDVTTLGRPVSEEMAGYGRRLEKEGEYLLTHPWQLLNPVHMLVTAPRALGPTSEHERGKKNRILIGLEADGTGIYMRMAWGKTVEDLSDYLEALPATLKSALSPVMRTIYGIGTNDAGFGRPVYDPYVDISKQDLRVVTDLAAFMAENSGPSSALEAAGRLIHGRGTAFDVAQIIGGGAGASFSHGFPGGPAKGILYEKKLANDYEIQRVSPDWRQRVKDSQALLLSQDDGEQARGQADRAKVVSEMRALEMRPTAIQSFIRYTLNPSLLNRRDMQLEQEMNDDQRRMLDIALRDWARHQQQPPEAEPEAAPDP